MPRFVIVMPNYNCVSCLGEAIQSALDQNYDDYEIVFSDNASSDGSKEAAAKFENKRLRVYLHDEVVGKTENWNRAYRLAPDCEYLVNLHTDDRLSPNCLSLIDQTAKQHKSALIYGGVNLITWENSRRYRTARFPFSHHIKGDLQKQLLLLWNPVHVVGVSMRRDVFDRLGGWPSDYNFLQDVSLFFRMADEGLSSYVSEIFGDYRDHRPGTSPLGQLTDSLMFWTRIQQQCTSEELLKAAQCTLYRHMDTAEALRATVPAENAAFHQALEAAKKNLESVPRPPNYGEWQMRMLRLRAAFQSYFSQPTASLLKRPSEP